MAARGLVNGRDPLRRSGRDSVSESAAQLLILYEYCTRCSQVLVNEYVPVEYVFDFASLDGSDVVVELEGLRTALAVSI